MLYYVFPKIMEGKGKAIFWGHQAVGWIKYTFQVPSHPGILGGAAAKFWRLNFCFICKFGDGAVYV